MSDKHGAAYLAAEAAAESWRRSAAGRWPELSVPALAELVILMGTTGAGAGPEELEPAWKRRGYAAFSGTLWLADSLIWTCAHRHVRREEAMACAIREARQRQEEVMAVG